jgi:hypothetical protein
MECEDVLVCLSYLLTLLNRYRWVDCQLELLRDCDASELQRTLGELPATLDETYVRILQQIPARKRDRARRLLQCLAVAARPLRVEELAGILSNEITTMGTSPNANEGEEQAIRLACSSLVTVIDDHGSRFVQFSHFSVKEFLTSEHISGLNGVAHYRVLPEPAHSMMAQACLAVLLQLDYRTIGTNIKHFPLADYVVKYFPNHVEFGNVISHLGDQIETFLDTEKPHLAGWIDAHRYGSRWWTKNPDGRKGMPLYRIAELGYVGMVRHLVSKRPQDVNAIGGYYGTALHVAVKKGNVDISRLLLEKIQDVNVRGDNGTTPLHLACHYGHIEIVQLILDAVIGRTSSNENAIPPISTPTSRPKPTALFKAILSRYLAPFRSPKASRSDENSKIYISINTRDSFGQTPLHLACIRENLVIMQLLRSRCGSKLPCLGGLCGRNHVIYDRGW